MKARIIHVAIFLVVFFTAGIGGSMAFNLWRTEGSKEPAVYSAGDFAGKANPADIRGSYTFGDIAAAFPVQPEALASAFGVLLEGAVGFQVKELETMYADLSSDFEIGTDSVRWFVALHAGLPFEPGEETALPSSALAVLRAAGVPEERLEGVRTVNPDGGQAESRGAESVASAPAASSAAKTASVTEPTATKPVATPLAEVKPKESASAPTEKVIKGSTTFAMLEDWGLARDRVAEILGGEAGPPEAVVRDWLAARGLEFAAYKERLQADLDALD